MALDVINFMDALKIDRAIIAGFDWGARSADIIAALWPERRKGLVSASGYLIGGQASGKNPLPPVAEFQWWYQYYFAIDRGRDGYDITLEGDANGAPHPDPNSYAKKFVGKYEHRTITGGIGHNLPQEAPQAFAQAVIDVDGH